MPELYDNYSVTSDAAYNITLNSVNQGAMAMRFTAQYTYSASSGDMYGFRTGTTTSNFFMELTPIISNKPACTAAYDSIGFDGANWPTTSSWVGVIFTSAISLSSGTDYALVLRWETFGWISTGNIIVRGVGSGAYDTGFPLTATAGQVAGTVPTVSGTAWTSLATRDYFFRIYGSPPTTAAGGGRFMGFGGKSSWGW